MKKVFIKSIVYSLVLLSLLTANYGVSTAQGTKNTIAVEPATINFELAPNEEKKVVTVTIHNQYNYNVNLSAEFRGIDENSGLIVPTGELSPNLGGVLSLSDTQISIPANKKYFLTVQVANVSSLPAGGHYGTLVLSQNSQSTFSSTIESEISLGIFVVKEQGLISKIELSKATILRDKFEFPSLVGVDLLNDGNSHVVPRGYLRLTGGNKVYYETVFNQDSKIILPSRHFTEEFRTNVSSGLLPEKIKLEVGYRADGVDEIKSYSESFWYVPKFYFIVGLIIAGAVIVAVIFRQKVKLITRTVKNKKN